MACDNRQQHHQGGPCQVKVQKTGRWAGLLDQGQQGPVKKQEKEAEKKKVEFRLAQQVLEASHKTSSRRAGHRQRQRGRDIGVFQHPLKKNMKNDSCCQGQPPGGGLGPAGKGSIGG
ncbi:MAG: hypothetical protein HGJ93_08960 [Desulfosarcina sp.]|nr:hypothetical protein [Desulfosarcina sp.]MBC2766072.1 hypothetical protein [Desulfosarcina sp.]